jgi:hypothetical protein
MGLHANPIPLARFPQGIRFLSMGQGSALICPTNAFWYGYQSGREVFCKQSQIHCPTAQELHKRLEELNPANCWITYKSDLPHLYAIGKMTGWLISAAKQSPRYGEIMGQEEEMLDVVRVEG